MMEIIGVDFEKGAYVACKEIYIVLVNLETHFVIFIVKFMTSE